MVMVMVMVMVVVVEAGAVLLVSTFDTPSSSNQSEGHLGLNK